MARVALILDELFEDSGSRCPTTASATRGMSP